MRRTARRATLWIVPAISQASPAMRPARLDRTRHALVMAPMSGMTGMPLPRWARRQLRLRVNRGASPPYRVRTEELGVTGTQHVSAAQLQRYRHSLIDRLPVRIWRPGVTGRYPGTLDLSVLPASGVPPVGECAPFCDPMGPVWGSESPIYDPPVVDGRSKRPHNGEHAPQGATGAFPYAGLKLGVMYPSDDRITDVRPAPSRTRD